MRSSSRSRYRVSAMPTAELYPVTDVLISDYSSLIYEYLLFGKPLVLYVPDLEEYRTRRGFYMAPEEIPASTASCLASSAAARSAFAVETAMTSS